MCKKSPIKKVVNVSLVSQCALTAADRAISAQGTIDVLFDDLLLEIFDLHREEVTRRYPVMTAWKWTTLAQVCRRWRAIILASPRRLHLRVTCYPGTPVKKSLDIWPPFPIAIICFPSHMLEGRKGEDNLVAALEHRDRISDIYIVDPWMERYLDAMQEPLPALTDLYLGTFFRDSLVLPDTFLGGYVPLLRSFTLKNISFPAFPKFVLHATNIVTLRLFELRASDHVSLSPEVMAACLAALPHLGFLSIQFRYDTISPLQTTPPPLTHTVLPSLTDFRFMGATVYLEDFIEQIDTPLLHELRIEFFRVPILHTPELYQFIDRTQSLKPFNPARVKLFDYKTEMTLGSPTRFQLETGCDEPGQQLSSLTQICNVHFPFLSQVDQLDIYKASDVELVGRNERGPSQWLKLLRPFSGVRSLYVYDGLAPLVAGALRELTGERTMEVLPALEKLSFDVLKLSGRTRDIVESFIAARQVSDRPVVVQLQKRRSRPKIGTPDYSSEDDSEL